MSAWSRHRGACGILAVLASVAWATDPPHNLAAKGVECSNCHTPHHAPGGAITRFPGNPNVCQSCHVTGGLASPRALANADQALPEPGLPATVPPSGNSHRWDSGPSGHVRPDVGNTSGGSIQSGGALTGRYPKTYTITITSAGDVGSATFSWVDTLGASGTGTAGADVALNEGITVTFTDGPPRPSFQANDRWRVHVRTDLNLPTIRALAIRVPGGKIMCSTCHDQHSQELKPFDPFSPDYFGPESGWSGTGSGRHYQRAANDTAAMCTDCHSARNVQSSAQGSHPVGVAIPGTGHFKSPNLLQLDPTEGKVRCLTCHRPHFGPAQDGTLRRVVNTTTLCTDCHTLAEPAMASHLSPTSGVLWPGGQYGSTFPAVAASKQGFCTNCHYPHGWPDNVTPDQDFPRLWVERYDVLSDGNDPDTAENLCFTCHDGSPARTDIRAEFLKGSAPSGPASDVYRHPIADSAQRALAGAQLRSVECVSCHNPHRAAASNKLRGTSGIDIDGNPVDPDVRHAAQHEVCFKCHGDTYNSGRADRTNKRLDFRTTNSAYHPVAGPGRNTSTNIANQLRGGLTPTSTLVCTDCHNSEATADAPGPASNSSASPKGPHGSTNPAIRRAAYWTALTGPASFDQANFALCYLCHDVARHTTADTWGNGASTNYYDDINGRDNLHQVHLVDRADRSRATCKNCHFNVHGNENAAGNTQYRIDDVLYTSPPPGFKTRLVAFSPDLLPIGGRARPEWWLNTTTRERRCYLSCHGNTMDGFQYRASQGDTDPLTIP